MGLLEDAQAARETRMAHAKAKAEGDERGTELMTDAVERCMPEFMEAVRSLGLRPPTAYGFMKRAWFVDIQIYAAPPSELYVAGTVEVHGNGSWSWSNKPWALSDSWGRFDADSVLAGVREAFLRKLG